MSGLETISTFVAQCREVENAAALHALVEAIARDMGFDYFSLTQMDLSRPTGERARIGISNYPASWVAELIAHDLAPADPTLAAARRCLTGFGWDEIGEHVRVTRRHKAVMERARRAGLGDGYAVPAHLPGELTGLATFVVRTGRTLPRDRMVMAQLIGTFAYEAARRIHLARPGSANHVALTPRQLDVTLQVARGKTDWEIAQILGVSEETVTEHVDAARARYGVGKRNQLVLRAIQDGHFTLADALGGAPDRGRTLAN